MDSVSFQYIFYSPPLYMSTLLRNSDRQITSRFFLNLPKIFSKRIKELAREKNICKGQKHVKEWINPHLVAFCDDQLLNLKSQRINEARDNVINERDSKKNSVRWRVETIKLWCVKADSEMECSSQICYNMEANVSIS